MRNILPALKTANFLIKDFSQSKCRGEYIPIIRSITFTAAVEWSPAWPFGAPRQSQTRAAIDGDIRSDQQAPGPATSRPHPQHPGYPYLLRGLSVTRPNQVWSTEDSSFCVAYVEMALQIYGVPEIFNTDQGCQFTATAFTDVLKRHNIQISMDGRGRALDNIFVERLWRSVKYENVCLKGYTAVPELMAGLVAYFLFYNSERPHQSLGYCTSDAIYQKGVGGGARNVS